MRIQVNGVWRETAVAQLGAALQELGYADSIVTTALNGDFVAVGERAATHLTEGDQLEVLAPMQGG